MTPRTKLLLGFFALALTASAARTAAAQTCAADRDCAQSYQCVESGVVNGTAPACPPNAGPDCPKPADIAPPMPVRTCQPKACEADAECGTGMVCYSQSSTICSGGSAVAPCAPGVMCPMPTPTKPDCTTTTKKLCAFRWQLPCKTDAECGDGFTCHPLETTRCAGATPGTGSTAPGNAGGGTSGSPGATDPSTRPAPSDAGQAVAPPDCTTTTSFPGYCQSKVTTCVVDTDCPSVWKCKQRPSTGVSPPEPKPTRPPSDGGTVADPAPPTGAEPPPATLVPAVLVCTPPDGLDVRRDATTTGTGEASGGGTGLPTSGNGMSGGPSPVPPSAPSPGAGATATPSSGGCSMQPAQEASRMGGLMLFTLLGVIAVRRLRRR